MKANIMKHDSQYINLRTGGMLSSRRDCVKGLVGLAGILATGQAPAAFVRSMLGARGMAFGGVKKGCVNPYDNGHLIHMWHWPWNCGVGSFDINSATMKDLAGSCDATLTTSAVRGTDYLGLQTSAVPSDWAATATLSATERSFVKFAEIVVTPDLVHKRWSVKDMFFAAANHMSYQNWNGLYGKSSLLSDTTGTIPYALGVVYGTSAAYNTFGLGRSSQSDAERRAANTFYLNGSVTATNASNGELLTGDTAYFCRSTQNAAGGPLLKFNSLRFYDAIPSASEIAAHWAADQDYFNIT